MPQRITPCLWFDGRAEEATNLYVSIFKDSKVLGVSRMGEHGPDPNGAVMFVSFQLEGQEFMGLNDRPPQFGFTDAVSFFVKCETQQEVDDLWTRLIEGGGEPSQCGWLKDKFGVSWQIIPNALMEMLADKDPEKAGRVMQAMLKMQKIDISLLEQAYA